MKQPRKPGQSLLIRSISLLLNGIGICFFAAFTLLLVLHDSLSLSNVLISVVFAGLAPLIVITCFLWYLKKPGENLLGIFIVTPAAIFVHVMTMGFAARATFLGSQSDVWVCAAELAVAILVVAVVALRKGHARRKQV